EHGEFRYRGLPGRRPGGVRKWRRGSQSAGGREPGFLHYTKIPGVVGSQLPWATPSGPFVVPPAGGRRTTPGDGRTWRETRLRAETGFRVPGVQVVVTCR